MYFGPGKGTQGDKDGFRQIFSQQRRLAAAAIEQQVERFFLRFVSGAQALEGLPAAGTVLRPRERALLPEPRGERERRALKGPALLKRDYLKAQLCDIVEGYGESLRMAEGPAAVCAALDARIARFTTETQSALQERLSLALLRGEPAQELVQDLCGLFEKNAQALDGHVRRCYRQAGWHRALQAAAPSGALFRVYAEGGGSSCKECLSRSGRTYTLGQLEQEEGLPPYHPHCRCVVLPVYTATAMPGETAAGKAAAMGEGAGETALPEAGQQPGGYEALRRIPADARRMLEEMLQAQRRRLASKTVSGILDWLSFGIVSGFWNGLRSRAEVMMEEPNLYTISNWLTLGFVEVGKEAILPEEPLSLQHWLSAVGFASSVFEVYRIASGNSLLSKLQEEMPEMRKPWKQSEIDVGKEHPGYRKQVSFLDGQETGSSHRYPKGSVRPDLYKKGHSIEVKNYNLTTSSGRNSRVSNVCRQFEERIKNLPKWTWQSVVVDIRGQSVPFRVRWELMRKVWKKTGYRLTLQFKTSTLNDKLAWLRDTAQLDRRSVWYLAGAGREDAHRDAGIGEEGGNGQ